MSEQKNNGAGGARPEDATVHLGAGGQPSPLPGVPPPAAPAPVSAPAGAKTVVAYGAPSGVPAPQPPMQMPLPSHGQATVLARPGGNGGPGPGSYPSAT